ncbi:MAG: hypothetical protein IPM74_03915 [Crocinitomicaceae bacterium]|nr:hypothetical protein [Crocinitomicaceae bacterium]MBK8925060.1 hypothetical protein [Crocinitomicaceae bacterium]
MAKYLFKYKIESTRLCGFDYTSAGSYFITICTKNRIPFFGQIVEGKMVLSEIGELAKTFWQEIPQHFPNAQLNEFIIMPDHMHGIICLSPQDNILPLVKTSQCDVSTGLLCMQTLMDSISKDVAMRRLHRWRGCLHRRSPCLLGRKTNEKHKNDSHTAQTGINICHHKIIQICGI